MNTIVRIHNKGDYRYEEHVAHATITPGMLLEINGDNEVLAHDTSGGAHEKMFALENALEGEEVTDNYAAGDVVGVLIGQSGTVVNALLNSGVNYTVGAMLQSNADGTLTTGTTNPVGVVETARDLTVSDAVDSLVPVRLL